MTPIDKFLRFIISGIFFFSIFTVSVFSQTELIVESDNSQVNEQTDYFLSFQTTIGDYAQINKGQLIVTLPRGFSVENLDSVEIIDDYKHINYTIKTIENDELSTHLFLNRDKSHKDDDDDDELDDDYPKDTTLQINVTVRLSKIQNPTETGDYQISLLGLRDNQKIAIGPLLSEPFTITAASVYSITVTPSEDISLKAGTVQPFSASAFDQYGNKIDGTVFQWSLFECSNCIGQFTDSSLFATRVGEGIAQAIAGGVSGFSGQITVTPGDLSRMTLQVDDTQFVGNIINHNAAVILYDAFNNLKTDYDLAETPIELILSGGELNRFFLDNNEFQVGGVVRINDFEIIYQGLSGEVSLYADNSVVSSNVLSVNFNNYDIVDVQNISGETISSVFAGHTTTATVLIQNNGNLKADGMVIVSYYWQSMPESLKVLAVFPPEVGELTVLHIDLPVHTQAGFIDELVVTTQSNFIFQSESFAAFSERKFPVEILDVSQLNLIADSFKPDTIIHQVPFDISFDVIVDGLAQTIDSTKLTVSIQDKVTSQIIADLFQGSPEFISITDGVIKYVNIPGILNSEITYQNGRYNVFLDYQLFSTGNMLTLTEPLVDSIYIFFDNGITLVEGSLSPKIVYAGTNVSFEFKVNIDSDKPYEFHGNLSQFRIYDDTYSSSTNLFIDRDSLFPGENILRSASISIQPEQVGSDLFAEAEFVFCLPGMLDSLKFIIQFTEADVPIQVLELPMVQIIDLEVISPNAPIVNSSQEIQFKATVANLSPNEIGSVLLELKSIDGYSNILSPVISIDNLQGLDTGFVFFNVVAGSLAQNLPESFRVDIYGNSIGMIAPINNSAFLIIEEEALLEVSYRINGKENAQGLVVSQGDHLHIQFDIENSGTAEITNGMYQFIADGLNANKPDTFNGIIYADSTIEFAFDAPLFDTVMQFTFSIIESPFDINYDAPAKIVNESIEFTILSVSSSAEIIVEAIFLGTNLILPGRSKEMFELSITNSSNSVLNSIQIETIDLLIYSKTGSSVEIRDVLSVGNTLFSENEEVITTTTAGGNTLMFWFTDFIIAPQQTRTILLEAEFKESSHKELRIELPLAGFKAVYSDGPNAGQEVIVKSTGSSDQILSYQVVLKGSSLDDSFIIEDNPFNPTIKPVQFAFELTEDASIEFQVFTLTGEEVFREFYSAGTHGASIGENIIKWDGCNNSGDIVLNGVYIASIINQSTGEYARIKVAVVK